MKTGRFRYSVALLLASAAYAQSARDANALKDLSGAFESLAERVRPAVVQIFAVSFGPAEESESGNSTSLFSRQRSTGSGVVMTSDGYIVTNAHVVQNARRVQVKLPASSPRPGAPMDGKTLEARIIGVDRDSDLAVVKIDRTGLPHLNLGNSNELHQGQLVMAFGSPLGLESSVSMGVVSATARQLKPDDLMVYVQTDAPINPGNSGGPLVDVEGRVVGINTLIFTQSGGSEGIGFAIPSNIVRLIFQQLKDEGHVHRGMIGIAVQSITPAMAKGLDLPVEIGAIVSDVLPGSPADRAKIAIGDILLSVNNHGIDTARSVEVEIFRSRIDETIAIELLHNGQRAKVEPIVIERKDDPLRFADLVHPEDNLIPRLGILAIQINDKLAAMLPSLRREYGLVVAARSSNGPTGDLQPGDVIYTINNTPAVTLAALKAALDQLKSGDVAVLQVERAGRLIFVPVELE